jgi:hypothetical protein
VQDLSSNGTDGSQLQTAALNQRIAKVEELLVEMRSALPVSARSVDDRDRLGENRTNISNPGVDQSSASGPSSGLLLTRCSLPPTEVGQALLTEYLRDYNSRVPLLAPEAIVSHMRDCYSGAAKGVASSWVLTYFVFGVAHRLRALNPAVKFDETSKTEQYLDNCLNSFSKVLLEEPNERIVQCLLGIAIMLQDSPKSHRVSSFVSVALRMTQELGYNEAGILESNNKVASYLFWIAFSMDANLSMCALRPNTQKHADIMTSLPRADDHDWWCLHSKNDQRTTNCPPGINFFFLHCSLAMLQVQVLEEVFSPQADIQPAQYTVALQTAIGQLNHWRSDTHVSSAEGLESSELLHLVTLEASYFRTMYQLVAAQHIGKIKFRYDLFSHVALKVQRYHQRSTFYEDARRLLVLLASPPLEILSLNR